MDLRTVNITVKILALMTLVLLVPSFVTSRLSAQEITGRILGSVLDTTGAAVPGADVSITNQDTGTTKNTVSGGDGLYNVPQVPPGTYTVEATAKGFGPTQVKDVVVTVGTDTRVDLKIQVGTVTQTVTVTEAAPLVETTSSSVGSTVDEQKIADLPLNGRNWTDLTLLQPGVTQVKVLLGPTIGAGFNGTFYSSNGAPMRANAVSLDGANEKNLVGFNNASIINTELGVDGIQEYKVVTNLFSAEYGLSMGSQTTIVSKGGTNQFHGDVFEYLRNNALDSRNYFDALDVNNANGFGTNKSSVYPGKRIPPFRRNNYGGSFGGPIKKDKTFFYGVFEGIREQVGQTIALQTVPKACFIDPSGVIHATIPAQIQNANGACTGSNTGVVNVTPVIQQLTNLFPQPDVTEPTFNYTYPYIEPETEEWGQMRIDHDFSAADSAFFRWTQDDSDAAQNYTNYAPFRVNLHSAATWATLGENHVFTPTLLNTVRFSFSRTWAEIFNLPLLPGINAPLAGVTMIAGEPLGPVSPGSGVTGAGPTIAPEYYGQVIYTLSDDIFLTKGKNAFKFGTLFNYYYAHSDVSNDLEGAVAFPGLSSFFAGNWSSISVLKLASNTDFNFRYMTAGFYVQDDYRVNRRLTLNLGLRYEIATVPFEPNPAYRYTLRNPATDPTTTFGPLFQNPTHLDFSPRLGFAWDVTGKGTTSIRGGVGIYYDIGNYGPYIVENSLSTPPFSAIAVATSTGTVPFPLTLPLPSNFTATTPYSPKTAEYRLGQPTMWQRSLTIDQQLPWSMGLSVGYVGSRGIHLTQQGEGNPVISSATDQFGRPIHGCWNVAQTVVQPVTSSGACPAGFSSTGPRTNLNWGQVLYDRTSGDSWYNALQVQLTKRVTQGLQFQFAYTLSKLVDDGNEGIQTEATLLTQAPFVTGGEQTERGPGVYDTPQNVRVTVLYHAPTLSSNGLAAKFSNGWWFSSIVSAQEGYPFSPQVSLDRALQNAAQTNERVNLDPSFNAHKDILGTVSEWFDPTEFDLQPAGYYGNAGRNILRGPGFEDVDFSIVKDTKAAFLGEAGNVEFRAEVFNLLNHPNFANPNATVYVGAGGATAATAPAGQFTPRGSAGTLAASPTAGAITGTVGNARQIQFALKLIF